MATAYVIMMIFQTLLLAFIAAILTGVFIMPYLRKFIKINGLNLRGKTDDDILLDKESENDSNLSEDRDLTDDLNEWERTIWEKHCRAYSIQHSGKIPRMSHYMRAQIRRAALRKTE